MAVDALAEKYPGFSPFSYSANNPVCYFDPDGKWVTRITAATDGNKYIAVSRTTLLRATFQMVTGLPGALDRKAHGDPSVGIPSWGEVAWSAVGGKILEKFAPGGEIAAKVVDATASIVSMDDMISAMNTDRQAFGILLDLGILTKQKLSKDAEGNCTLRETDNTEDLIVNPDWIAEKGISVTEAKRQVDLRMEQYWKRWHPDLYERLYGQKQPKKVSSPFAAPDHTSSSTY
jgi:hypothetical protein